MTEHRNVYYPPNQNLGYAPPTTTKILLKLMHIVGWVILIPGVICTLISLLAVLFGIAMLFVDFWSVYDLIGWLILLAVSGGMLTLGLFMTGKIPRS